MKNKRLYTIILLAALALLQVRVAFAACEMGPERAASSSTAAPCDHQAIDIQAPGVQGVALVCAPSVCIEEYAAQGPAHSTLLNAGFFPFAQAPPPAPYDAFDMGVSLHAFVTPAHAAHTPLIYVLQRLLI